MQFFEPKKIAKNFTMPTNIALKNMFFECYQKRKAEKLFVLSIIQIYLSCHKTDIFQKKKLCWTAFSIWTAHDIYSVLPKLIKSKLFFWHSQISNHKSNPTHKIYTVGNLKHSKKKSPIFQPEILCENISKLIFPSCAHHQPNR